MGKNKVLPPSTNRGVENTYQGGLRACVDWLQVTFKNVARLQDIADLLGLDFKDFTEFHTGKYGYNSHLRCGNIAIYFNCGDNFHNVSDYYFHLEMTGQGCREWEENSSYDWVTFLGLILMLQVNITRLDLAVDDFQDHFRVKTVIDKAKRGHVRSKFKKARRIEEYDLKEGQVTGATCYFGRPQSDIQVRFYDKYLEREGKGKTIESGLNTWVRTEIQLRDKRAQTAAYELVNNIADTGKLVKGILSQYINFLVPSKDSNKARWKICKWWLDFLGDVEKVRLAQVAPDRTVEKVRAWVEKSVAPSLFLLVQAYKDDPDLLAEILEEGASRFNKKHLNMLMRFIKERDKERDIEKRSSRQEDL